MSDELKKTILETYLKHTEIGATTGLWYHEIAKELGLDKNQVETECAYLEDDEYIEKIEMEFSGGKKYDIGVRITSKGKEALRTIYNPEWIKQNRSEQKKVKDIEEKRHQELVKAAKGSKIIKIAVVSAVIISLFALFGVEDVLSSPTIKIEPFFADASNSTTQMYLNLWNHGNSPATNVRVTLNPNADFLKTELIYSAEDTNLENRGLRSVVAFTPRLSAGDLISIDTTIGIPNERSHFDIYVTYDQGEKVSYSSRLDGKTEMDRIVITIPADGLKSAELSVYDPVSDEFITVETYP